MIDTGEKLIETTEEARQYLKIGSIVVTNLNYDKPQSTSHKGVITDIASNVFVMRITGGNAWEVSYRAFDREFLRDRGYEYKPYIRLLNPEPEFNIKIKVATIKERQKIKMAIEKAEIKSISIEVSRVKGKTLFKFQVPTFLEELYKARSEKVITSEKWPSLNFYSIPDMTKNEEYKRALQQFSLTDDYGSRLLQGNVLNIAWLRTQGGQGEIEIADDVSLAQINTLTKNCITFLKKYFQDFLQDFKLKANLNMDIE